MKREPIDKIVADKDELVPRARQVAGESGTIVFTNGCFGLLHPGHAYYLHEAARLGSALVVAVNTDTSYQQVKGRAPLVPWNDRALLVASLESVDLVVSLDADTPHELLRILRPDFLVKSDTSQLPATGHEVVEGYGGQVIVLKSFGNYSTTALIGYGMGTIANVES